jgi:hypothetical protein
MNYIRRLIAFILSITFCVALIIGLGVILAIKNVNIEFIKYSADGNDQKVMAEYEKSTQNFEKLKGSNLLFLSDDDITKNISNGDYLYVSSYEKVFPCTVNIQLKERRECFAYKTDDGYNIYDETGATIRQAKTNLNSSDSSPNVLIVGDITYVEKAAQICGYFKNSFSALRGFVESVEIEDSIIEKGSTFTFNLYSGLKIILADYDTLAEEKIKRAYDEYTTLSDADKLQGAIRAVDKDGTQSSVQAVYIK